MGSGTFHGTRTCKTRACPVCARVRAERYADWAEDAFEKVPQVEGYAWRFITLTTKYDPYDAEDLTAAALAQRVDAVGRAGERVWRRLLSKNPGSGLLRTIECGKKGHVHANLVYYGPVVTRAQVEAITSKVDPCLGHAHVINTITNVGKKKGSKRKEEEGEAPEPRGSKAGLRRVARYVSKGLAHEDGHRVMDEDWNNGDTGARTVDPQLAARWEVATYRRQLAQRYGSLRGIRLDEHAEKSGPDHEADTHVACTCCGEVGAFRTVRRNAVRWFDRCHSVGMPGLHRTLQNDPRWKTNGDMRPPDPD